MDPATLQWVQADIEQTLTVAREALERFAENPGATHHMQSCADALHAVHGVLEMLEYYGACLLLEEMESVCSELLRGENENRVEGYELLLRSILQLAEYLNYLRTGHQDTPTIFMPLLNDLRCLRGEPLLSENALFAPALDAPIPLEDHGYQLDDAQVREIGRRLRAYYQKGLLDWYQGTIDGGGLALMQAVVMRAEKLCGTEPFARLWWIAAGVVEALKDGALEPSVAVRRLLALLDKELKRIGAGGMAVLAEPPDADLVKNLLYYVARSSSNGERATTIREIFALDDLFVGEDASRRAERILSGPDLDSLKVVAAGIREDLNGVKSSLDAFVRKGAAVNEELGPVADRLRRVADTLGLLNLGRSRKRVAAQVERLRRLAEGPEPPGVAELMDIASDLLHIDATLDSISRQGLTDVADTPGTPDEAAPAPDRGDTELSSIEYLRLVTAVVGEATTELAAIKHAISEYLREPGARDILTEVTRHVKVVEGSLRMLSLERAADLLRDWGQSACELLGGARPPAGTLDALADALVSLEYYLESVVGLQPNVNALLGFTEDCIRSLQQTVAENAARGSAAVAEEPEIGAPEPEEAPQLEVDDDILEVFIDEAREVLQTLDENVPRWIADPADRDALVTTRRAFHTLKGSGRLVGALDLGELAWSAENLLNRVLEGICPASRSVVELVTEAYDALPALVDALEQRRAASVDVAGFAARARDIVEQHENTVPYAGDESELEPELDDSVVLEPQVEAPAEADEARAAEEAPEALEVTSEPDDTRRVFVDEATRILEFCASIIGHWRNAPQDRGFVKELQRELHTLKGGARTAGFSDMADLSHAMESVLLIVSDGHLTPSVELLDLMDDCQDRLVELLDCARLRREPEPVEDLITRMDELVCPGISNAAEAGPGARAAAPASAAAHAGNGRLGAVNRGERIQIAADFLDNMADCASELSISQSRFGQQVGSFKYNLDEMGHTIERLRDQIRRLETETESQIPYQEHEPDEDDGAIEPFDTLEMDRYSRVQQLSRALLETVSDLESIQQSLGAIARESDSILTEQSRVNKDLQQGLMRTRMMPFASQVQRFRRLVRRTMTELGKRIDTVIDGEDIRLDRTILERITPSIEHMLRNAVDHGIEEPATRKQLGKPEIGTIRITVSRTGPEVVIRVEDDGNGLDRQSIYQTAVKRGLVAPSAKLTDEELFQLVLEPGFSTVRKVTQISGRGVGLDVVNADIKQFGGVLEIDSSPGHGCAFTIRLPFTLAVNHALLVKVDQGDFALPMSNVVGVVRASREDLRRVEADQVPAFEYNSERYHFAHLGTMLEFCEPNYDESKAPFPVVLVRAGDNRMAFLVEGLTGRREIVIKPLGPQLASVRWISGATVLGDGSVAMILDVPALVRRAASLHGIARGPAAFGGERPSPENGATVMVVDDSITVRQVTQRLLNRNGIDVVTAKDGLEALALLKDRRPDVMLLDIEMPRMDGFELAATIRKDARLKDLPIIMITSRTGSKHSDHASQIGVNRYIGKPYHESELLENINSLLGRD